MQSALGRCSPWMQRKFPVCVRSIIRSNGEQRAIPVFSARCCFEKMEWLGSTKPIQAVLFVKISGSRIQANIEFLAVFCVVVIIWVKN